MSEVRRRPQEVATSALAEAYRPSDCLCNRRPGAIRATLAKVLLRPQRPGWQCRDGDFGSRHPGGSNFAFAGGSVRFLQSVAGDNSDGTYTLGGVIFQALGTRAGGEAVPVSWCD